MSDGEFQIPDGLRKLMNEGEDFFAKMAEESKKVIEKYGLPDQLKTKKKEEMTGIELITNERLEQKVKHGYSPRHDAEVNSNGQLIYAAIALIQDDLESMPADWDPEVCKKMMEKPYEARLVIAGALIAAEIDRKNYKP